MKLIKNGKFYTEDPVRPWAEAVVIDGKRFAFAGTVAEAEAFVGNREVEVTDLSGKTVLPGLIDGHSHHSYIARSLWIVYGDDLVEDKETLFAEIERCVKEYPPEKKPYLVYAFFEPEATFGDAGPTAEDLGRFDRITGNRPVRINDNTGHGCWYNSAALDLLKGADGVPKSVSPIAGQTFVKDASGNYTGQAFQTMPEGDVGILKAVGWEPPKGLTDETAKAVFDVPMQHGVCCIMDAGTASEEDIRYLYEQDRQGKLNMQFEFCSLLPTPADIEQTIAKAKEWKNKYETEHIRFQTVKFFGDGSNEFGDVLSTEPFPCDPTTCGRCNATAEEIRDVLVRLNQEGLDLHVHTVCDGTIRVMLDGCKAAQKICGKNWKIRLTLAHCEIIHPDDVHRFKELGVWVDWTPSWAGDASLEIIPYMGKERWRNEQDYSQIMADGDIVGFSTDEMEPDGIRFLNPFRGIQIGITRVNPDIEPSPEYYPNGFREPKRAKLTLEQLIHGFTMTNAKRMRIDHLLGSIEPGKLANMVVLEDDIFTMPAEKIQNIRIDRTYFDGRESWRA